MARAHFRDVITSRTSDELKILSSATVAVRQTGTTTAITETIYSAATGATTLSNPLTSDSNGVIEFWLARPQRVDLYITATGYSALTLTVNVEAGDEDLLEGALIYNVTQYGALGDGSTGPTSSALQSACNAANTSSGGQVYLPPGVFVSTAQVTIYGKTTFCGAGMGATTLKFKSNANTDMLLVGTSTSDVEIRDLTIDGDKATNTGTLDAITATSPTRLRLKNLRIVDCDGAAIDINTNPTDCVIEHCLISSCGTGAAFPGNRAVYVTDNTRIDNCVFHNASSVYTLEIRHNCIISNCRMVGSASQRYAILVGGSVNLIEGCDIDYSASGSSLANDNIIITNYNSSECVIVGNRLRGGTNMAGIYLGGSGASAVNVVTASRNVIGDNTITGCMIDGILIGSGSTSWADTGTDNAVVGNVVTDSVRQFPATSTSYGVGIETHLDRTSIVGNIVTGCKDAGIWISQNEQTIIGNVVRGNQSTANAGVTVGAIRIGGHQRMTISDNVITDNGSTNATAVAGILLQADYANIRDVMITNNIITDTRGAGSKAQTHGVMSNNVGGNTVGQVYVIGNYLSGNATSGITLNGTGGSDVIRHNIGYDTEANGTATVVNGQTSVVVTHGLEKTPTLQQIAVTPTNNMGNATKFWISTPTATQFTINVNADPGAGTATFAWQVHIL